MRDGIVVIIAFGYACSDSGTAPEPPKGIQFVAGATATDTAGAQLVQALVVEVRDSTGVVAPPATVVRFTSALTNFTPEVFVGTISTSANSNFIAVPTDDAGRAAVLVRLGFKAGPARLEVNVPTLGLIDTAMFTVTAGQPATVRVTPSDTLLLVGGSYTVSGTVSDRNGNPRPDAVSFASSSGGVTVSNAGVVTATAVGRSSLTATAGTATATANVSVVPALKLAAWRTDGTSTIVTMDIDGSNQKTLATVVDGGIGAHPVWIPGTNNVAFTTIVGSEQRLRVVDQNGSSSAFIANPPSSMTHQAEPTPAAGGAYMFFGAHDSNCANGGDYCLYRSTMAGANPQLLMTTTGRQPAPSPDGSQVAFVPDGFTAVIRVRDVASATTSGWSVAGIFPRWSPDGARIAYNANGRIMLVNPDGSNNVALTGSNKFYTGTLAWSPDSKWIITKNSFGPLELIDAQTGAGMPLPYSVSLSSASIK